jgi:hypothetical protein
MNPFKHHKLTIVKTFIACLALLIIVVSSFFLFNQVRNFSNAASVGYGCGPYNGSNNYSANCGTFITSANVGNSTDCITTNSVTISQTYTCNFPLTGDANNDYGLPAGGVVAQSSQGATVSANSSPCTISGSVLTCIVIPTNPITTPGSTNVNLQFGGAGAYVNKGVVNLVLSSTTITSSNVGNSSDCISTLALTIGQTYICNFPLTGGSNYGLPAGGVVAQSSQGATVSANSSACTISGSVLTCTVIPTNPIITPGSTNVDLQFGGAGAYVNKGVVNLVAGSTPLSAGDLSSLSPTCSATGPNSTMTCTFTLPAGKTLPSGLEFGVGGGALGGTCTVNTSNLVTCNNIPTGSQTGTQVITASVSGNAGKVNTSSSLQVPGTSTNGGSTTGGTLTSNGSILTRTGGSNIIILAISLFGIVAGIVTIILLFSSKKIKS